MLLDCLRKTRVTALSSRVARLRELEPCMRASPHASHVKQSKETCKRFKMQNDDKCIRFVCSVHRGQILLKLWPRSVCTCTVRWLSSVETILRSLCSCRILLQGVLTDRRLKGLVRNLTYDELRTLQAKIDTRLRPGPVEKLPLELSYEIFQHLKACQIFQSHYVSRRWYRILSSPEIVEPPALRP